MEKSFCLVHPPTLSTYNDTDIKEDPILTAWLGYLDSIQWKGKYKIFDFQLDKSIESWEELIKDQYTDYIIAVRDAGENYYYTKRLAFLLSAHTASSIWLYGQVAPLRHYRAWPARVSIVNFDERELARNIGISAEGACFGTKLSYLSYYNQISLQKWQWKSRKGAIETTRGCPFRCKFCFINAGKNFEMRWQTRSNDSILSDMKRYLEAGVSYFIFLDSEFLGADKQNEESRRQLLRRMCEELPPVKFMIWCRADTLLRFNEYDLLKQAGLVKVLLGVESFYQADLDALKKGAKSQQIIDGILRLIERKISCYLTFITFNSNTTMASLRFNLDVLENLHNHPNAKYLGLPNFVSNMEIARTATQGTMQPLSNQTYVKPVIWHRGQDACNEVCFPVAMEPLMEIYRLLHFEWSYKKSSFVHLLGDLAEDHQDKKRIHGWFDQLGLFCIGEMRYFLDQYEAGLLSFDTLADARETLFSHIADFYRRSLPPHYAELGIYDSHAKKLNYLGFVDNETHGWDEKIPMMRETSFETAMCQV